MIAVHVSRRHLAVGRESLSDLWCGYRTSLQSPCQSSPPCYRRVLYSSASRLRPLAVQPLSYMRVVFGELLCLRVVCSRSIPGFSVPGRFQGSSQWGRFGNGSASWSVAGEVIIPIVIRRICSFLENLANWYLYWALNFNEIVIKIPSSDLNISKTLRKLETCSQWDGNFAMLLLITYNEGGFMCEGFPIILLSNSRKFVFCTLCRF